MFILYKHKQTFWWLYVYSINPAEVWSECIKRVTCHQIQALSINRSNYIYLKKIEITLHREWGLDFGGKTQNSNQARRLLCLNTKENTNTQKRILSPNIYLQSGRFSSTNDTNLVITIMHFCFREAKVEFPQPMWCLVWVSFIYIRHRRMSAMTVCRPAADNSDLSSAQLWTQTTAFNWQWQWKSGWTLHENLSHMTRSVRVISWWLALQSVPHVGIFSSYIIHLNSYQLNLTQTSVSTSWYLMEIFNSISYRRGPGAGVQLRVDDSHVHWCYWCCYCTATPLNSPGLNTSLK